MTDIAWCKIERLKIVTDGLQELAQELNISPSIEFLYFENNPEVCKKNAVYRGRKDRIDRELELIDEISKQYYIPDNISTLSVVDASWLNNS